MYSFYSFSLFANEHSLLDGIFVEGSFQRYITVAGLEDYTIPKPGWRATCGYEFFRDRPHRLQLGIKSGHSVIAGSNPLVRTLDIIPLAVSASYSYTPPPRIQECISKLYR